MSNSESSFSSSEEDIVGKTGRSRNRTSVSCSGFNNTIDGICKTSDTEMDRTPFPSRAGLAKCVSDGPVPTAENCSTNDALSYLQRGFSESPSISRSLFHNPIPSRSKRKRNSSTSRRSRLSQSLLLDDYTSPRFSRGIERRKSLSFRKLKSFSGTCITADAPSPDVSSMDTSPDSSPSRNSFSSHRRSDSSIRIQPLPPLPQKNRSRSVLYIWGFLALSLTSSIGMILLAGSALKVDPVYQNVRHDIPVSAAGLRGQMTSGHWEGKDYGISKSIKPIKARKKQKHQQKSQKKRHAVSLNNADIENPYFQKINQVANDVKKSLSLVSKTDESSKRSESIFQMHMPPHSSLSKTAKFPEQDVNFYASHRSGKKRVVALDPSYRKTPVGPPRSLKLYPADFTDSTQLYSILDSSDERLAHMEPREPLSDGECVPMQKWQTTFHPSCNGMHEIMLGAAGEDKGNDANLFGTKGFWRYAWRLDVQNPKTHDTVVLKTLKFEHNFEDAHFEHDRIDAVAMERLTSSPHVIDVFGFCGHSVLTEYADGPRVGELADKSKRKPLARLQIARDIANGLADVHGIDGDGNTTFVHLDVNPANVVSVGGTLKLNDFNIGILRRWNTTSGKPCGFPAQYPNPQWRSPEEARNEQYLTEKVDVFSMGHIFFRLICGHEPWNKLEPGGRPSNKEIEMKVKAGNLPYIPDFIQNSKSPEIIAIRDAMISCYTFDPLKRPDARQVANTLNKALKALTADTKID